MAQGRQLFADRFRRAARRRSRCAWRLFQRTGEPGIPAAVGRWRCIQRPARFLLSRRQGRHAVRCADLHHLRRSDRLYAGQCRHRNLRDLRRLHLRRDRPAQPVGRRTLYLGRAQRGDPAAELSRRRIARLRRRGRPVRRGEHRFQWQPRVQEIHPARLAELHAYAGSQHLCELFEGIQGRRLRSARRRRERPGRDRRQSDRRGSDRLPQLRARRGRQLRDRLQGQSRHPEHRRGSVLCRLHRCPDPRFRGL